MVNCSTFPCGTSGFSVNSGAFTYVGPMRKFPSTFGGGFAPGVASMGLAAASPAEGAFLSAAWASASALLPAGIRAGVPEFVGNRVAGCADTRAIEVTNRRAIPNEARGFFIGAYYVRVRGVQAPDYAASWIDPAT